MLPLYEDPWFTFRFADARLIPRFHLEGVPAGRSCRIFAADPQTLQPAQLLATAVVGAEGWVELPQALVVRAGDVLVVYPDRDGKGNQT